MIARSSLSAALIASALPACTGMTLGENEPGQDTQLDPSPPPSSDDPEAPRHAVGALAVERDEDRVWLVHREIRGEDDRSHLAALDPESGAAEDVLDVTGTTDRRIVFPSERRAIVMAQEGGIEHLVLYDTDNLAELRRATKPTWYWGTRTSPSGRFLAVADNADPSAPIHLVDTATLEHAVVPHGGVHLEAMWNHGGDKLLAVSLLDGPEAGIRLLRWNVTGLDPWPEPDIDVVLPGLRWDLLFSFTWIGISPDDRWAVFPLLDESGEHVLAVLDQSDGTVRQVPGRGPVGFTADGSAIVSYGYEDGSGLLYLIDPETLATERVDTGLQGGLRFFATWDGNYVVATSTSGKGPTLVYHPETGQMREATTISLQLREFVTRPGHEELWLAEYDQLYRLALAGADADLIGLPFQVEHVNVLPSQDRLALSPPEGATIRFLDMSEEAVDREVELPSPLEGEPPPSILATGASARLAAPSGSSLPRPRREIAPGAEVRLDP